jgi:hypothetical protein
MATSVMSRGLRGCLSRLPSNRLTVSGGLDATLVQPCALRRPRRLVLRDSRRQEDSLERLVGAPQAA